MEPGSPWLNWRPGNSRPRKEIPGRGFESSEPPASNRLWAPALSLIQIFRSRACASAHAREASDWPRDCWLRERCSPRDAFQSLLSEIGGGVSVRDIDQ